jgi:hypothetical protein
MCMQRAPGAEKFHGGASRQLSIPSREKSAAIITVSVWLRGLPGIAFFQQSVVPPGLKYWHGGLPTTGMAHIAIQDRLTARIDWLKKVSDEQYPHRGCPRLWQHEDRTPTHGYTATPEAAMSAFAKSWRREGMKMPRQAGLSNGVGGDCPVRDENRSSDS